MNALHPTNALTPDGRPLFPADLRDLPPDVARTAVFVIAIGRGPEDKREEHEKTVAACEGDRCVIQEKAPFPSSPETRPKQLAIPSTVQSLEGCNRYERA